MILVTGSTGSVGGPARRHQVSRSTDSRQSSSLSSQQGTGLPKDTPTPWINIALLARATLALHPPHDARPKRVLFRLPTQSLYLVAAGGSEAGHPEKTT